MGSSRYYLTCAIRVNEQLVSLRKELASGFEDAGEFGNPSEVHHKTVVRSVKAFKLRINAGFGQVLNVQLPLVAQRIVFKAEGVPYEVELDAAQAQRVLNESLEIESRIAQAFDDQPSPTTQPEDSPYAPFATVAQALSYQGDPTLEPSPFFTSMEAYRRRANAAKA